MKVLLPGRLQLNVTVVSDSKVSSPVVKSRRTS
jgi:hypothetical protein